MDDDPQGVAAHYRGDDLVRRLQAALTAIAPGHAPLAPRQLTAFDQFHVRGLAATADLAALCAIGPGDRVLDIGAGVGGPARWLAQRCGCRVVGIDLSAEFVDAARYLTQRTGQGGQVSFRRGDALATGFESASFDVVLLQHVAMNIRDRAALYREIRRVLRPGGRFATHDVVRAGGGERYPLPWAREPAASFLLDARATCAAIEAAGLRRSRQRDDTPAALAWASTLLSGDAPRAPGLDVIMGDDFPLLARNLAHALQQERLGVLMAVFDATGSSNPAPR